MERILAIFHTTFDKENRTVTTRTEYMRCVGEDGSPTYEADLRLAGDRAWVLSDGAYNRAVVTLIADVFDPLLGGRDDQQPLQECLEVGESGAREAMKTRDETLPDEGECGDPYLMEKDTDTQFFLWQLTLLVGLAIVAMVAWPHLLE